MIEEGGRENERERERDANLPTRDVDVYLCIDTGACTCCYIKLIHVRSPLLHVRAGSTRTNTLDVQLPIS